MILLPPDLNLSEIALLRVKSLVFVVKCSVVESLKSGSTPNSGVPLNVVPSSTVPNLLPNMVENNVLIRSKRTEHWKKKKNNN